MEYHSSLNCAVHQKLMQPDAAQRKSSGLRKFRVCGTISAGKSNSFEWHSIFSIEMNPKGLKRSHSVRQQSFSAGFVDRRRPRVQDNSPKALLTRRNCSCDSRRSGPHNHDFCIWTQRNRRTSCQMPASPVQLCGQMRREIESIPTFRASTQPAPFSNPSASPRPSWDRRDPIVPAHDSGFPPQPVG